MMADSQEMIQNMRHQSLYQKCHYNTYESSNITHEVKSRLLASNSKTNHILSNSGIQIHFAT